MEQVVDGSSLHLAPEIHDQHPVSDLGDHAEIVGVEDDRHALLAAEPRQQRDDLRLQGDVERGRRLVGNEDVGMAGQAHGDQGALAHAPAELVGVGVDELLGVGHAHPRQKVEGLTAYLRVAGGAFEVWRQVMKGDGLADLVADRVQRTERTHRFLEDHGNPASAHRTDFRAVGGGLRQFDLGVTVTEHDRPAVDTAVLGQDAQDRQRRHALARTALAHDSENLVREHLEAESFDGDDITLARRECDAQLAHP